MSESIELFGFEEFNFERRQIRVIEMDGNPWFIANDVAEALGYEKPRNAVSQHCKGALKQGVLTSGGTQEMTLIPESVRREAAALGIVLNSRRWNERLGRAI